MIPPLLTDRPKWVTELLYPRLARQSMRLAALGLPAGAVDSGEYPYDQLVSPTHQSMVLANSFWVANHLAKLEPDTVVDVGCGDGDLVRNMSQFRMQPVYLGLDVRPDFKPRQGERVQFWQCDFVKRWPVKPGSVHHMVASEVLEHMPFADSKYLLYNMVEALAPGGHLLLTLPVNRPSISPEVDAARFGHYCWWDASELLDELRVQGFAQHWCSMAPRDGHSEAWWLNQCGEVLGTQVPYVALRERYNPGVAKQLLSWLIPLSETNHLQVHFTKGDQ